MPRATHPAPAERLAVAVGDIVGNEWNPPPAGSGWPVVFTHPATGRTLTMVPDRRNNRIVIAVAPADDPDRPGYGKYTPDITGYGTISDWLSHGGLTAVFDALAVVVRRLIEQPPPDPFVPHPDPVGREMERLARHARELAELAARFNAGLVRGGPVADAARRIAALAQQTEQTATRVDELCGPAPAACTSR